MAVHEKLSIIQSTLSVKKQHYNSFGKYFYRSCEDILSALKPFLQEHKLVLLIEDSIEFIEGRFYVKATAKLVDCEDSSQIVNSAYAREEDAKKGMDAGQVTGSVSSYARKYALNGLFCIDDTKDADTDEQSNQTTPTITKEQVQNIKKELIRTGLEDALILTEYVVSTFDEMTLSQYEDCMRKFAKYPAKK